MARYTVAEAAELDAREREQRHEYERFLKRQYS
jgi:hypothetical protein